MAKVKGTRFQNPHYLKSFERLPNKVNSSTSQLLFNQLQYRQSIYFSASERAFKLFKQGVDLVRRIDDHGIPLLMGCHMLEPFFNRGEHRDAVCRLKKMAVSFRPFGQFIGPFF